tara:strand:+ start:565 stop:1395 length:831 start_codon:yes stop_codon:yes gene_type:complete
MSTKRIRQINVIELDQAMYSSTYEVGLEMANWLNASMHVCMLETKEQKAYLNEIYGIDKNRSHIINRDQVEEIIKKVQKSNGLLDLGFSIEHFDEEDSIERVFKELSIDESLSVLGYNKSTKHKEVLKKLLKVDFDNPLLLVPMGKTLKTFHKIIVPFEPEFVTKRKLEKLKWYTEQLGVMIDFVHFKKKGESREMGRYNHLYETIFSWVDELKFNSEVKFRFPKSDNLNSGLTEYIKDKDNYLLCVIDSHIRASLSTSKNNKECLMDIKEPVVIL